jgi:hypothetical protein
MKWTLAIFLTCRHGGVWTAGNRAHPFKGLIAWDADKETCLLQTSLKTGRNSCDCTHKPEGDGLIKDCMEKTGWFPVKRRRAGGIPTQGSGFRSAAEKGGEIEGIGGSLKRSSRVSGKAIIIPGEGEDEDQIEERGGLGT